MSEFNDVSKTLFVPLGGRIYASTNFPEILYDEKALQLRNKVDQLQKQDSSQSQYTFLASAVRSHNIDLVVRSFLNNNINGVIIELGCGMETTYYRCNGNTAFHWYILDLPEVITFREQYLPNPDNMTSIKADILDTNWISEYSSKLSAHPVLFIASGLFQYFEETQVIQFLKNLKQFNNAYVVFDAVSKLGMKGTRHYMKQLDRDSAATYFYCDNATALSQQVSNSTSVILEQDFYRHIDKSSMQFMTKLSMNVSDMLHMVKLIELML